MKISNIVISNLATFPYIEDMSTAPGVSFPTSEKYNISIFIGPNGSGKSTFLEIIQQITKSVLFLPYSCDISRLDTTHVSNSQEIIHLHVPPIHNIYENAKGEGKPSFVHIKYMLNDDDRNNLQFVYEHQEELNQIIAKYSHSPVRFNYKNIGQYIASYEQILCKVQVDPLSNTAWLLENGEEDIEKFILDFFKHFFLIQHCIAIHNALYPEPENHWHSVHATSAFIGGNRDLMAFTDTYTIGLEPHQRFLSVVDDIEQTTISEAQDHLVGLLYMKKKAAYYLHKNYPDVTDAQIKDVLQGMDGFSSFEKFCIKYLRRHPIVKNIPDHKGGYIFSFVDDAGRETLLNDLSAGEKSILGIILTVYGFGLHEGLLVIEEPELHLHPQMQKRILGFLEEIAQSFGLQCIMVTHSPLMINENNIRYVYRFSTENNVTQIITPGKHYNEESSKLMQILRFTNTAKIFFVKKIIMVEGETDEYAFSFLLHYLANTNPYWEKILQDYEIVNINGKGGYVRWKKFLRTFGIQSYFIGDWDNIQEIGGEQIDMRRYLGLATHHLNLHGFLSKSQKYEAIIVYLRKFEPYYWKSIQLMIHNLYKKNIFILEHGDIEAYFGMQEKGLEETFEFLHNEFLEWINNAKFLEKREELEEIFKMIFDKQYDWDKIKTWGANVDDSINQLENLQNIIEPMQNDGINTRRSSGGYTRSENYKNRKRSSYRSDNNSYKKSSKNKKRRR